jgi:hypothetical protein
LGFLEGNATEDDDEIEMQLRDNEKGSNDYKFSDHRSNDHIGLLKPESGSGSREEEVTKGLSSPTRGKASKSDKDPKIVMPGYFISKDVNKQATCKTSISGNEADFSVAESVDDIPPSLLKIKKNAKMELMINFVFDPHGIHAFTIWTILAGFSFIGVLLFTAYYKSPTQEEINSELRNTLVINDLYSWEIYGILYAIDFVEHLRLLKEGHWAANEFANRGFVNYWKNCTTWMGDAIGLIYVPDRRIDLEYSIINKTNLIRLDEWYNAKVQFWWYDNITNPDGSNGGVRWYQEYYGREMAAKMFEIRASPIAKRDYENDTSIPDIWTGTGYDFDRDPEEQWLRLNSIGDMHKVYTHLSWMNIEFEKSLVTYSENVGLALVWTSVIASGAF